MSKSALAERIWNAFIYCGKTMRRWRMNYAYSIYRLKENPESYAGKAESYFEAITANAMNISAANQYVRVVKKLTVDLDLPDSIVNELAENVNFSTLDMAASRMTRENMDDVIAMMLTQPYVEAQFELRQLDLRDPRDTARGMSPGVSKLLRDYHKLPHDQKIEAQAYLSVHRGDRKILSGAGFSPERDSHVQLRQNHTDKEQNSGRVLHLTEGPRAHDSSVSL